ncbi:MAG: DUF5687 family protein [Cloacibacterium normanense]
MAGAYNKKPIDLNSASKGFTSGQNNFNIKILVLLLPQMVLPMAVFGAMKYFFGMTPCYEFRNSRIDRVSTSR